MILSENKANSAETELGNMNNEYEKLYELKYKII